MTAVTNGVFDNPLASIEQLENTPCRKDGIPNELEEELRNYGTELIQSAGILLRLPQTVMATAQVLFQRFYYLRSFRHFGIAEIGMGALFLASKVEESMTHISRIITVFDHVMRRGQGVSTEPPLDTFSQQSYDLKAMLLAAEMQILKHLGFNVHVQLPYGILVNYLRILGLEEDQRVANRSWAYLNDALRTTVYCTYQPHVIAVAAIWLACRQEKIKLPTEAGNEWWLLFDVRAEDFKNIAGHIQRLYYQKLDRPRMPLFTDGLDAWLAEKR